MPLIDDGIRYKTEDKSTGYELIDGEKDTVIGITPTPRGKKTTPQPNYSTVTEWFGRVFKIATTIPSRFCIATVV